MCHVWKPYFEQCFEQCKNSITELQLQLFIWWNKCKLVCKLMCKLMFKLVCKLVFYSIEEPTFISGCETMTTKTVDSVSKLEIQWWIWENVVWAAWVKIEPVNYMQMTKGMRHKQNKKQLTRMKCGNKFCIIKQHDKQQTPYKSQDQYYKVEK